MLYHSSLWPPASRWNVAGSHGVGSSRKIARELGVHRETVGRYLHPAQEDSKPAIVSAGSKAGRTSQCAPLRAVIEQGLAAGHSAQRMVAGHGFTGAYDAVKRFVRRLAHRTEPPFRWM